MDSIEGAEQYANEKGVQALRDTLAAGLLGERGAVFAKAYLARYDREQDDARQAQARAAVELELDNRRRELDIQERSARAT